MSAGTSPALRSFERNMYHTKGNTMTTVTAGFALALIPVVGIVCVILALVLVNVLFRG
jgi:biopolymer transport protein ExbB/TolQ